MTPRHECKEKHAADKEIDQHISFIMEEVSTAMNNVRTKLKSTGHCPGDYDTVLVNAMVRMTTLIIKVVGRDKASDKKELLEVVIEAVAANVGLHFINGAKIAQEVMKISSTHH